MDTPKKDQLFLKEGDTKVNNGMRKLSNYYFVDADTGKKYYREVSQEKMSGATRMYAFIVEDKIEKPSSASATGDVLYLVGSDVTGMTYVGGSDDSNGYKLREGTKVYWLDKSSIVVRYTGWTITISDKNAEGKVTVTPNADCKYVCVTMKKTAYDKNGLDNAENLANIIKTKFTSYLKDGVTEITPYTGDITIAFFTKVEDLSTLTADKIIGDVVTKGWE